jgi:hypothetical protein
LASNAVYLLRNSDTHALRRSAANDGGNRIDEAIAAALFVQ